MGKMKLFLVMFTIIILTCNVVGMDGKGESENKFKHAINMCPGGIAFGIFSANYQYFFNQRHGIVFRLDYESIPKDYTDAKIEASGAAFIINYRWHFSGKMNSMYLGAYARYRVYRGKGTLDSVKFDFSIPEFTFGLNIGKRWVWKSGFNINLAFGYGISTNGRNADPDTPAIDSIINDFEKSYDFLGPFLGEFSIGYAF